MRLFSNAHGCCFGFVFKVREPIFKLLHNMLYTFTLHYTWNILLCRKTLFCTNLSKLSASVALIQKPVNWFAQFDWFLYEGNTGT